MPDVCDYRLHFILVSVVTPGSLHDYMAYQLSSLYACLEEDSVSLPEDVWIDADGVYFCSQRLLTPWPGRSLPAHKDCFGCWFSSARVTIEQAFGDWEVGYITAKIAQVRSKGITNLACVLQTKQRYFQTYGIGQRPQKM